MALERYISRGWSRAKVEAEGDSERKLGRGTPVFSMSQRREHSICKRHENAERQLAGASAYHHLPVLVPWPPLLRPFLSKAKLLLNQGS